MFVFAEMTVGKDQDIAVKTKGAGGQGKVGAKVTAPSGKPVASKVREAPPDHHQAPTTGFLLAPPAGKAACKVCPLQVEPGLSPETSQVKFIPREAGPYQVELTYDGVPIPGSPFSPTAYPAPDPSKVSSSASRAAATRGPACS